MSGVCGPQVWIAGIIDLKTQAARLFARPYLCVSCSSRARFSASIISISFSGSFSSAASLAKMRHSSACPKGCLASKVRKTLSKCVRWISTTLGITHPSEALPLAQLTGETLDLDGNAFVAA